MKQFLSRDGQCAITVHSDQFLVGYQQARTIPPEDLKGLSETQIYNHFAQSIQDVRHHDAYKAGALIGWVEALLHLNRVAPVLRYLVEVEIPPETQAILEAHPGDEEERW